MFISVFENFLLIFIGVQLLYNVVLVSAVQQNESVICIYISPLFFRFPSHLGHHSSLSRVPFVIQQVLISFIGIFLTRENFCFDWLWKRTSSSSYNFTYLIIGIIFLRLASDSIYIKLCFSFSTTYFSVEHLNHITV